MTGHPMMDNWMDMLPKLGKDLGSFISHNNKPTFEIRSFRGVNTLCVSVKDPTKMNYQLLKVKAMEWKIQILLVKKGAKRSPRVSRNRKQERPKTPNTIQPQSPSSYVSRDVTPSIPSQNSSKMGPQLSPAPASDDSSNRGQSSTSPQAQGTKESRDRHTEHTKPTTDNKQVARESTTIITSNAQQTQQKEQPERSERAGPYQNRPTNSVKGGGISTANSFAPNTNRHAHQSENTNSTTESRSITKHTDEQDSHSSILGTNAATLVLSLFHGIIAEQAPI